MSLLTLRLVFLCVDAYCFIFWDLLGDVLAAPASALCGWIGVILVTLSLVCMQCPWQCTSWFPGLLEYMRHAVFVTISFLFP